MKAVRDSRGAALVELAIALPLVVMLVVGMVSAAIAYNHQLALSHAAREGARFGATLPTNNYASMNDWLDAVATSTVGDATGTLAVGAPGRSVCVAFVHPDGTLALDSTKRRLDTGGAVAYDDDATCFTDGRPDSERRVQVVVERDSEFGVVFWSSNLTLDSEAASRFEAALGG
jgi:Flp pilus assembly protein TadG